MGITWGNSAAAGTPYERDPRALPILVAPESAFTIWDGSAQFLNGVDAWNHISRIGSMQTADPTTGTRTIMNVSGRGRLTGVIGPGVASGAATTTFTITVDGTVYTVVGTTGHGSVNRVILGNIFRLGTEFTTASHSGGFSGGTATRHANTTVLSGTGDTYVLSNPMLASRFIKFDKSLKVEVASSSVGGGTYQPYAAAIWNLDG